ncbi:MAG: hypothetical protein EOO39_01475, partial [Cytophagaceae bacterium]
MNRSLLSVHGQFHYQVRRLIPIHLTSWLILLGNLLSKGWPIQHPFVAGRKQATLTFVLLLNAFAVNAVPNHVGPVALTSSRLAEPMAQSSNTFSFFRINENQSRSYLTAPNLVAMKADSLALEIPLPNSVEKLKAQILQLERGETLARQQTYIGKGTSNSTYLSPIEFDSLGFYVPLRGTMSGNANSAKVTASNAENLHLITIASEAQITTLALSSTITTTPDTGTASTGTGGIAVTNVVANDAVDGVTATLGTSGNATVSTVGTYPAGISLNTATGSMSVTQGTTPGSYMVSYQLCDKLTSPTCSTETATITVSASISTTPDAGIVSTGTGGVAVSNVAANDAVNGVAATLGTSGNATVATVGTYPTGISLNTATGSMSVTQGTTPGSYMVSYQLCDKLTTPSCSTETATITVNEDQPTVAVLSPANNGTATTTFTISGTATPGSAIVITGAGNTTLCTTTASVGGSFACLVTVAAGAASVTVVANTAGGSSIPAVLNFTAVNPSTACVVTDCGTNVRYGLKLGPDGITYTVYMKSARALTGSQAQIGTAQVTVVLPAGTAISNVTSLQSNTNWGATNPVLQPTENPTKDYRSFGLTQSQPFAIGANIEIPLFSFQRVGSCTGELALWNTGDPFGYPNSLNTTPGNQMAIAGYGNINAWTCDYTCPVACPVPALSLLKLSSGTATQYTPFSYTMTALNSGNGATTNPITVSDILPAGMTFVSGGGNGWTCAVNGQLVTCTSSNTILAGSSSSFVLTVNPTLSGNVPNSATLTGGGSVTVIESIPCANCVVGPTVTDVSPAVSDLVVSIQMPSPFLAGQANGVTVTLTNALSGLATGPQSISVVLANGLTAPATFSTVSGWTCSTTGQTVVCSNPASLSQGQILSLPIPVIVSNSLINSYVIITAQAAKASTETNIDNNYAYTAATLVLGSDLALSFGGMPILTPGQNAIIPISISNGGQATAPGTLTVAVTLPTGVSLIAANLPAGWLLTSSVDGPNGTTIVTLTNINAAGLAPSEVIPLNLPVAVGLAVSGNVAFTATVAPIPSESNTLNNTNSVQATVAVLARPDLIISAAQPTPILTVGQSSDIAVTITNIGSASAAAPTSFTIVIPVGLAVNTAALPTGWAVGSLLTNPDGSSAYTFANSNLSIAVGQSTSMNLIVTPGTVLGNTMLSLNLYVNGAVNETNLANNGFTLITSTPVQWAPAPDLAVVIPAHSFTLAVGQPSLIPFTINNIGTATAAGPLSLTITMPTGFNTSAGTFTTGIWGCSAVGVQVICTTASNLIINAASSLTLSAVPGASAGGMINPTFQISVAPASGETILANNVGTLQYIGTVIAPDLAVSFPTQSFTLIAAQTSNILVQVSNVSTIANAAGPLSMTFAMPLGFSVTQSSFSSGGWSCSATGAVIGCTFPGGLSAGASLILTMPVIPVAGITNPSFVALVSAVTGEVNLANNMAQYIYSGTVLPSGVRLALKAILQGPFNDATGLMNDDLRRLSLISTSQPYRNLDESEAVWVFINSGSETTTSAVLSVTGTNAIVDWVMVELRSSTSTGTVVASKMALLQRDGDVVSSFDGISPLTFSGLDPGSYYVVIRHRNHLGVMSKTAIALSPTTATVDLTNAANVFVKTFANAATAPLYTSTNTVTSLPNPAMLWAGDTNGDGLVIFQGGSNDLIHIFTEVLDDVANLNLLSNFISTGYTLADTDLDGSCIFQGPKNEVNMIFFNVLGHPDNTSRYSNFIILHFHEFCRFQMFSCFL